MNKHIDNQFPDSRRQRQVKAWSMPTPNDADNERYNMNLSDWAWLGLAAVVSLVWGGWLAYVIRGWLKTF